MQNGNKQMTVGVIGCGRIAESAHFPALSKIEGVKIKYACDLIKEKAEKFGAERVTTDYHELISDPEVDAVWVLTPNASHYDITLDALAAGKHVFCEKPITVSYEKAVIMAKAAEAAGKNLQIGVCNRFHRSVKEIRELVRSGKLGEIYHVYCSFRSRRGIPGLGGPFTMKSESGGGVLIDWGVHFMDIILYVLGGAKIRTVSANTYSKLGRDIPAYRYNSMWAGPPVLDGINDVEEFVTGFIRTDSASISFNGAWAQNIAEKDPMHIDFLGDKGGARLIYRKDYSVFYNDLTEIHSEGEIPDMYLEEDAAFIASIRTGEKNDGDISNILESQKLLDCIYKSAELKREVTL